MKPHREELKCVLDLQHLIKCVEHMFLYWELSDEGLGGGLTWVPQLIHLPLDPDNYWDGERGSIGRYIGCS
jgi:hypothetical protein